MTDNITLPRVHALHIREVLLIWNALARRPADKAALAALRAALAEPEPEPEPVAWMYVNLEGECEQIEYGTPSIDDDSITLLYAAPPKPPATREPATRWQITDAYCEKTPGNLLSRWDYFYTAWQAAERFHGITKEDKT
jgi:hypothetical protein